MKKSNTNNPIGLYIHIPFCKAKCPYCDFYSSCGQEENFEEYIRSLKKAFEVWAAKVAGPVDSIYFGGGTPSLIGSDRLAKLTSKAKEAFNKNGEEIREITAECNPSDTGGEKSEFDFENLATAGVNRISLGLQSALDSERKALGRIAGSKEAERAVKKAKAAGIENISLDLMLAIPGQNKDSLKASIDFCAKVGAKHISAYILKIEEGTPFAKVKDNLNLPDEDETAEIYLFAAEKLEEYGFKQYEISNFALPGYECFHNLKYWNCEEYLGLGPTAHSFISGKRFFFPADTNYFIDGQEPIDDGRGGEFEEYAMLRLRLTEGISEKDTIKRFGHGFPESMIRKAKDLSSTELLDFTGDTISLTPKGFLLSNSIISELLS
ncbi:MAG TPA: radical SAM family heme chaperone HemW [Clostridiales bacterium]|nr:radical SAM family heme chaperone HemW [Clostridiales bacterium]